MPGQRALLTRPPAGRRGAMVADRELVGDPVADLAARRAEAELREQQFGDAVGLLEMRVAGADDRIDADRLVFADALGDLVRRADQRGAGAAAHQPDAGPQVGRDEQPVAAAAMQLGHAALADRIHLLAGSAAARSRSARR